MIVGIVVVILVAIGGIGWMAFRLATPRAPESLVPATTDNVHFAPLALAPTMSSEVMSTAVASVDRVEPACDPLPDPLPEALLDTTVVVLESSDGTVIDPLELQFDEGHPLTNAECGMRNAE